MRGLRWSHNWTAYQCGTSMRCQFPARRHARASVRSVGHAIVTQCAISWCSSLYLLRFGQHCSVGHVGVWRGLTHAYAYTYTQCELSAGASTCGGVVRELSFSRLGHHCGAGHVVMRVCLAYAHVYAHAHPHPHPQPQQLVMFRSNHCCLEPVLVKSSASRRNLRNVLCCLYACNVLQLRTKPGRQTHRAP